MKRYDFISVRDSNRRVDLRISEDEGDWVRYDDIKHLIKPRTFRCDGLPWTIATWPWKLHAWVMRLSSGDKRE